MMILHLFFILKVMVGKEPQNLNKRFIERIGSQLDEGELKAFITAHNQSPQVSVRINPGKIDPEFKEYEKVPWSKYGRLLPERPSFTQDPLFHSGSYYVQESSSMLIGYIFQQLMDERPVKVLDMCAAPGGKSTLLASILPDNSILVCNEAIPARVPPLLENIIKWGSSNTVVTQNDPDSILLNNFFDLILIDAPCSGEGLFRKEPASREQWSDNLVRMCSSRQKRILGNAIRLLKPGGYIIYTTCTYAPEENQMNVKWMRKEFHLKPIPITTADNWQIGTDADNGLYLYPHKNPGEGFFAVCLKKPTEKDHSENYKSNKTRGLSDIELKIMRDWINMNSGLQLRKNGDIILAGNNSLFDDFDIIVNAFNVKLFGGLVGTLRRGLMIPHHHLSMIPGLPSNNIERFEVDKEDAICYLKRAELRLQIKKASARKLISYKTQPLGWVKPLGNRINNYYPVNWRIRN